MDKEPVAEWGIFFPSILVVSVRIVLARPIILQMLLNAEKTLLEDIFFCIIHLE